MYVGKPIRRLEDARLLTGRGRFVDDIRRPGELHAVFLRSPHPAARIRSIDKAATMNMPGVRLVLTGEDWRAAGLGDLPVVATVKSFDGTAMTQHARPVFATDSVRHVGDTVAMVVADSLAQAMDGAEAIAIDYEPLPAIVDLAQSLAPGAPKVHAGTSSNLACDWRVGDEDRVAMAMANAVHVIEIELVNQRLTHLPIEPRAVIGEHDPGEDGYTLWTSSQAPHLIRRLLAQSSLGVPEHRIRVIAPDVGGGFGQKGMHYPEEAAVLRASRLLERPVRWTATRNDGFMVDIHARSHVTRARAGFNNQGHILAITVDTLADFGAYLSTFAAIIPTSHNATMLSGLYRVPALYGRVRCVHTNTTPVDAMRGAGRSECAYAVERLIEAGARQMAIDPAELRRRNLIQPHQFPYQTSIGPAYDSGDYPALLDKLGEQAGYDALLDEQAAARRKGELMGIGWSCFITSGGPGAMKFGHGDDRIPGWDSASLRVHSSGKITLSCGSHSHGQGHATAYRQVVADALGCALEDIEFINGDTAKVHAGMGTYASRSITVVGGAIALSAARIIDKGKQLAAHLLECAGADLEFAGGRFTVKGTDRAVGFAEVAHAAYGGSNAIPSGFELGLEATSYFEPDDLNYPAGAHLAVVRVDGETGQVTVLRYVAVDDVGRLINPMIVEGQIHGGVATGIGQALGEIVAYDSNGQLLTGSLMDYAAPRARDLPMIESAFIETPSPRNPLGVKGAGESGAVGAPAAIVNAVIDALSPLGISRLDMPLTPFNVWRAMRAAR